MNKNASMTTLPFGNMMLVLSAIIGGILSHNQVKLNSLRPTLPRDDIIEHAEAGHVPSRMWEDPFEILDKWKRIQKETGAKEPLVGCDLSIENDTLLVPVIMSPAKYPEARENRLQQRYAILAALNTAGYIRDDQTLMKIGSLTMYGCPNYTPFETFTRTSIKTDPLVAPSSLDPSEGVADHHYKHVIVFWVSTDFDHKRHGEQGPLTSYTDLFSLLMRKAKTQKVNKDVWVRIIGPRSSDEIQQIITEILDFGDVISSVMGSWNSIGLLKKTYPKKDEPLVSEQLRDKISELDRDVKQSNAVSEISQVDKTRGVREDLKNIFETIKKNTIFLSLQRAQAVGLSIGEEDAAIDIFSPWATADYGVLALDTSDAKVADFGGLTLAYSNLTSIGLSNIRQEILDFRGIRFNRTISRDDTVVKAIIDELELRGISFDETHSCEQCEVSDQGTNDRIVLLGEWDSLFSRALSLSFAFEYRNKAAGCSCEDCFNYINDWPKNIKVMSYLRGIDGLVPGAEHKEQREQNGDDENSLLVPFGQRFPEGSSQYDYLRRLSGRIKRMRDAGENIKAIGIFGSDPYDKLLILRALRMEFPETIFFTTDLDARYAHSKELQWTRNLIVGSSYGLELHENLQKGVPPFRSSYQTANYATMLSVVMGKEWGFNIDDYGPRIFEIGHHGAFDLSPEKVDANILALHPPNMNQWGVHKNSVLTAVLVCLIIPVLFLTIVGYAWAHKEDASCIRGNQIIWGLFLLVGLTLSWGLYRAIQNSVNENSGEPLVLFEGISVWPTVMMRVLVFVLSLYYIIRSGLSIRSDRKRIGVLVFDEPSIEPSQKLRAWLVDIFDPAYWASLVVYLRWPLPFCRKQYSEIKPLWGDYTTRRHVLMNYFCLFGVTLIYLSLFRGFIEKSPPFTPFRGAESFFISKASLGTCLLMMITLCVVCFDAMLRCSRFIQCLYNGENGAYTSCSWPSRKELNKPVQTAIRKSVPPAYHWENIRLVGFVTETTSRMILYPFVVLFIMILSRSEMIDAWNWTKPLLGVVGLTISLSLAAAVYMRLRAQQAKRIALDELKRIQFDGGEADDDVERYIKEIQEYSRGAFSPWSNNPIILAILTPFGGLGLVSILQSLSSVF